MNKIYYTKDWESKIIKVSANSVSMAEAASKLPMNFKTFVFHAKRLGVYRPNPSGRGMKKPGISLIHQYKIEEILSGKYPQYGTSKLLKRLLDSNIKPHKCERCGRCNWNNNKIPLEIHHKDGNSHNHMLENLEILCPNCHAQTQNYRGRKTKKCRDFTENT